VGVLLPRFQSAKKTKTVLIREGTRRSAKKTKQKRNLIMNNRDRAFLHDMHNFITFNRVATVEALYQGLCHLDKVTNRTISQVDSHLSEEAVVDQITILNQEVRIQSILIAKIFAEQMAGLEDLGAFGWTIRHRQNGGLFERYLESKTTAAADFFDLVLNSDEHTTLDLLLHLPSVSDLQGQISSETMIGIEHDYSEYRKVFYDIARKYRLITDTLELNKSLAPLPEDWGQNINIIIGFSDPAKPRHPYIDAFNKIKHRFMITENLPAYIDIADRPLQFSYLSQEPKSVERLLQETALTARLMGELVALIIRLDEAGVDLKLPT